MKTNLKVVGGTTVRHIEPPAEIQHESRTGTNALDVDQWMGQQHVLPNKSVNEYWREYALYHQNVKSVVRISRVFADCLAKWKAETQFTSSMTEIILHPSYQRIIGLGSDVIPFVLQELAENGGHWFWALQAITGENPVAAEDRGRTRLMTEAWLMWGKQNRLLEQ
jgi:hypothetical protein